MITAKQIHWEDVRSIASHGFLGNDTLDQCATISYTISLGYRAVWHKFRRPFHSEAYFKTMDEAKLWCQSQLNSFIQSIAEEA